MRKRYQQGSVTKSSDGRYWIGKYREDGRHKTKLLGKIRGITKSEAQERFTQFMKPLAEISQKRVLGQLCAPGQPYLQNHLQSISIRRDFGYIF